MMSSKKKRITDKKSKNLSIKSNKSELKIINPKELTKMVKDKTNMVSSKTKLKKSRNLDKDLIKLKRKEMKREIVLVNLLKKLSKTIL